MANGNGLTAERMISAIKDSQGFVVKACEILDCSRTTFYNYLKKYATVQQALDDVREARHDFVELQLMKGIKEGNITAIIFYLKTQCKHRGYVERQEHSGPEGDPITVRTVGIDVDRL